MHVSGWPRRLTKMGHGFRFFQNSFSCINENLAINNGGYLFTNILHAIIAEWLNASQEC